MKKLICLLFILMLMLAGCADSEINDPGPPTEWDFDTPTDFFALEEAMNLSDDELEICADEKGWWLVYGFDSIRDTAERICEMVYEVKIPQADGYKMEYITVNPEDGRSDVFVRLQGAQTIHVIYTFEKNWETKRIASLGIRGKEKIENPDTENLYFIEHDENIKGEPIYRFGAVVDGKYVRIFVFGGTYEDAEKMVSAMRFVGIDELRG